MGSILKVGEDLDMLVAAIIGWQLEEHEFGHHLPGGPFTALGYDEEGRHIRTLPQFSSNLSDALIVMKWLGKRGLVRMSNGDGDSYDFDFMPDGRDELVYGRKLKMAGSSTDSWALAICETLLRSAGVIVDCNHVWVDSEHGMRCARCDEIFGRKE